MNIKHNLLNRTTRLHVIITNISLHPIFFWGGGIEREREREIRREKREKKRDRRETEGQKGWRGRELIKVSRFLLVYSLISLSYL